MEFIEWRATPDRNVEVTNDTADLYRYADCTAETEFLYDCVARAVDRDLPEEIDFLRRQDEAQSRVMETATGNPVNDHANTNNDRKSL
ncbi:MAG: hypothetical protein KBG29_04245 [Pseudomonadales bacterium]|jgi:hypothetical protein|nr:hypothetical protein [Pseudomonadales bacterium]